MESRFRCVPFLTGHGNPVSMRRFLVESALRLRFLWFSSHLSSPTCYGDRHAGGFVEKFISARSSMRHQVVFMNANVRRWSLVAILILPCLAKLNSIAAQDQGTGGDTPPWTPSPSMLQALGPVHKAAGCSIRPPRDFQLVEHPNAEALKSAGIHMIAWTKQNASSIPSTFSVISFPPAKEGQGDSKTVVDGFLESLSNQFSDLKAAKQSTGTISGIPARRVTYQAVAADGTRLAGFLLVLIDDRTYVQIIGMTINDGSDQLRQLANAALTFDRTE
jgi:hypothetical protein